MTWRGRDEVVDLCEFDGRAADGEEAEAVMKGGREVGKADERGAEEV